MVHIGIAGIGFMGMIHFLAAQRVRGARVTAVSSRDAKKLAAVMSAVEEMLVEVHAKVKQ